MFTIPRTVAPSSGAVITTTGAWSSGLWTYTSIDVSAARLELSYAIATMWCHPFSKNVVSQTHSHVHHDAFPEVSVARVRSFASIPTRTLTIVPSVSQAFPWTVTVPDTVEPAAGSVIRTCGCSPGSGAEATIPSATPATSTARRTTATALTPRIMFPTVGRGMAPGYLGRLERR